MAKLSRPVEVVVAGHICLDVIPEIPAHVSAGAISPGSLVKVGPALRSTGGAVANTGLALHRLGAGVRLVGKVGRDLFADEILNILRARSADLASGMIISQRDTSSYTVVISPPGVDRTFLHCPGANDTLTSRDVPDSALAGARLLHFGYPPLMRQMYLKDGLELGKLLRRARGLGLTTSLDMAEPDAASEAGQVDWVKLLRNILPYVDIFVPSVQELLFMADRATYTRLTKKTGSIDIQRDVTRELLHDLSGKLLEWGVAVVLIKLGDQGAYLRASDDKIRLAGMGGCTPEHLEPWLGKELFAPCYQAKLVGTTGSGDCTIAGFLAGILKCLPPEQCLRAAVAVGACSVEAADATSGVPDWNTVDRRIKAGWKTLPSAICT